MAWVVLEADLLLMDPHLGWEWDKDPHQQAQQPVMDNPQFSLCDQQHMCSLLACQRRHTLSCRSDCSHSVLSRLGQSKASLLNEQETT